MSNGDCSAEKIFVKSVSMTTNITSITKLTCSITNCTTFKCFGNLSDTTKKWKPIISLDITHVCGTVPQNVSITSLVLNYVVGSSVVNKSYPAKVTLNTTSSSIQLIGNITVSCVNKSIYFDGNIKNWKCSSSTPSLTILPTPSSSLTTSPTSSITLTVHPTSSITLTTHPTSSTSQKTTKLSSSPTLTTKTTEPIATSSATSATVTAHVTSMSPSPKITSNKRSHSAPKAALLVLAVVILLTLVVVAIYFKRKKRLSNQPAYYNDIAINDPLHCEMDDELADDVDDDDQPLFP